MAVIDALIRTSSSQSTLPFASSKGKGKTPNKPEKGQTRLNFASIKGESKAARKNTQEARLREMVMSFLGAYFPFISSPFSLVADRYAVECVRVNPAVLVFFRRVNLIYFRWYAPHTPQHRSHSHFASNSTQHTPTLLVPSLLARARKRSYAAYAYQRSPYIWPTRAALLAYERALALEADVEELLAAPSSAALRERERSAASQTPAPGPPRRAHLSRP